MLNSKAKNFIQNLNFSFNHDRSIFNIPKDLQEFNIFTSEKKLDFRIIQEISYKCSANCPYCMNKGLDYFQEELPVEEYINFYKKLIANGHKIKLKISGGEPTQPNVIERTNKLVAYALNEPSIYSIQINTNGYWPIPISWKNNKLFLQISLDGDNEYMEQITGLKNIYYHIIENFNFCINNDINFQVRSVLTNDNESFLPLLESLSQQYKKLFIINLLVPVGGGSEKNSKDELLKIIYKHKNLTELYKNNEYLDFRRIVGACFNQLIDYNFNCVITPSGNVDYCAFLLTENLMNNKYNIYNFNCKSPHWIKIDMKQILKDKTCCFPKGFLNFWNSLNEEEKLSIKDYVEQTIGLDLPSLKEFYGLEV